MTLIKSLFFMVMVVFCLLFFIPTQISASTTTHIHNEKLKVLNIKENEDYTTKSNNSNGDIDINKKQSIHKLDSKGSSNISFWGLAIPIGIFSSIVSTAVTFSIYLLNRKNAKKQLKFDLAIGKLLPEVYIPIINELTRNKLNDHPINFKKIISVISENYFLLSFAPKKINEKVNDLFLICKRINGEKSYNKMENQLVELLTDVEKQISKRFGALKDE